MGMTPKHLDRDARTIGLDGIQNNSKSADFVCQPDWIVTDQDEEVNGFGILDCIKEPGLIHKIGRLNDLRDVRVAAKIE